VRHSVHAGRRRVYSLVAAGGLLVGGFAFSTPALAAPPEQGDRPTTAGSTKHNLRPPWAVKQDALRQVALQRKLQGDPSAQGSVVKVGGAAASAPSTRASGSTSSGKGQFVKLRQEGSDRIFVVIAEFGDSRHPAFCDSTAAGACEFPSDGSAQRYDGPAHNEIPQPDRSVDNSTLWQPDYDRAHYDNMYFTRMADYYERQSSGRYTVNGEVTEWVRVPFNQARYGRDFCGDIVCNNTWFLLRDALSVWTEAQLASGMSMTEIQDYLKTFDVQDRYDSNGNGDFTEPDGFIDHFQIVHAGGDQAAGDPAYGADAIWSHRWYAAIQAGGPGGFPGINIGSGGASGGLSLPHNPTGVWVGDYTIQPENGGLGVFAHEFGHDLGLPDLYDTSGNTGGGENSTGFWTLMSSGANIGDGGPDGIGDDPTDLGVWELFQLGWLDRQGNRGPFYDVAFAGERSTHTLSTNVPASTNGQQALFVVLPEKERIDVVGSPASGTQFFYSGQGNGLNNTMTKTTGIAAGALAAKVRYDIEANYDYAFVESSSDGGSTWDPVATNLSSPASSDQSGFNSSGTGITGVSTGYASGAYVNLTATLPAGTNALRFRYQTDAGLVRPGFAVDDIAIGGTPVGNAEGDEGWAFDGFIQTTGTVSSVHFNAYVAENRQYDGYDRSLRTAYNFGFLDSRPDWVEHFPYQNGLLISYWDESFSDNSVGDHPGGGLILPVDAHPDFYHSYDGHLIRPRFLTFDSTFGLERVQSITLHKDSQPTTIPSRPAVKTFDDTKTWWFNSDQHAATGSHVGRYQPGWYGVNVPKTGTTITVTKSSNNGARLNVLVAPK
jgi:immune inhibitor A